MKTASDDIFDRRLTIHGFSGFYLYLSIIVLR